MTDYEDDWFARNPLDDLLDDSSDLSDLDPIGSINREGEVEIDRRIKRIRNQDDAATAAQQILDTIRRQRALRDCC